MKTESYCGVELPHYFDFGELLSNVQKVFLDEKISMPHGNPRDYENVNYQILASKGGRYAWRPFELIHPALYVSLVERITQPDQWKLIQDRFKKFQKEDTIKCLSIPLQDSSSSKHTLRDRGAQIKNWWQSIEQRAIELSLEYNYIFRTDIEDCYADIYTHSIAWAIHCKETAKDKRRDKTLIGNVIDWHIQDMRHGQTNGIPQGSVLMDFICEIVLGYADLQLNRRLKGKYKNSYQILRYRDDYRIFVTNPQVGEAILKTLTEVLNELGLKLNPMKTKSSHQVVAASMKPDKRAWLLGREGDRDLQKHLLVIHAHGMDFPGAGSLKRELSRFYKRLKRAKKIENPHALIGIAVDIAYTSPQIFYLCVSIIGKLLNELNSDEDRISTIKKIHSKLSQLPNTGHMEVWLQRISYPWDSEYKYGEKLCELVNGKAVATWDIDWIENEQLKTAIDPLKTINRDKLCKSGPIVELNEISPFVERY